jgi:hypothetical protein
MKRLHFSPGTRLYAELFHFIPGRGIVKTVQLTHQHYCSASQAGLFQISTPWG